MHGRDSKTNILKRSKSQKPITDNYDACISELNKFLDNNHVQSKDQNRKTAKPQKLTTMMLAFQNSTNSLTTIMFNQKIKTAKPQDIKHSKTDNYDACISELDPM